MSQTNCIDIKYSIWRRTSLPKEEVEKLERGISAYGIEYLDTFLEENERLSEEDIVDTIEQLDPEDNGGQATIEIYKDEKLIYDNAKKGD